MTAPAALGLRERKRIATRRAIQHAVLTLAAENGLESVTVEEASRIAGISPRTFFNYFGTKDEALIGDIPFVPDGDAADAFVAAGPDEDILSGLGELLAESAGSVEDDLEIHQLRKNVLRDHPHLLGVRIASMRSFEEALYRLVDRRVVADDPSLEDDAERRFDRAWMLTMIAFAGLRHAWRCWADAPTPGALGDRIRLSFDELYTSIQKTR
ncbi:MULTISPECIES: TetR/AcrR family transcriptional regulator [unclassified Plantibacter]|jgi:AcrR family transcriptional regulator|uniref:TetR/AcrR family transcriptional regulator n=1 Tax=unclassified Plantibacter TaxID=2624265 RepID=UPI003D341AB0